jgi:hypothetical protein
VARARFSGGGLSILVPALPHAERRVLSRSPSRQNPMFPRSRRGSDGKSTSTRVF